MRRSLTLAVIVIVIAGIGTGAYLHFAAQPTTAAASTDLPIATVQRGTLAATVNTAGNIAAAQSVALNFQQSGSVRGVDVRTGDQVKAGQVLAELDTTGLQLQVENAQITLKIAQDKLAEAKNPNTQQDIASAKAQLEAAQANYDKLVSGPSAADKAAAQAAVNSARAAYDAAGKTAGTQNGQIDGAAAAVDKAQAAVKQAQAAYDRVAGDPNIGALPQSTQLQQATIDYQLALANYRTLQATVGSDATSKVQQAKAQLAQSQADLAKLQPTQNDIAVSQAQVTQAQNNLDKLLSGSDAYAIGIAEDDVNQAQIALEQARLSLQQARITAPFDGVVTAVNITPGQTALESTQGAIQIADLGHLETVVNLAEIDINRVKVGQEAQIVLDAVPNVTLQGKVIQIAPAGVQQQGVVNYPVWVQLTSPTQSTKAGMTANLSIVVAQRDGVLMVPNRAIRAATPGSVPAATTSPAQNTATPDAQSQGANGARRGGQSGTGAGPQNGNQNQAGGQPNIPSSGLSRRPTRQQFVTVLKDGQQQQVTVQTGLSSDTMTEIISGLNEGDVVVLNATATTQPRVGGPGLGIPGVGGFGR